MRLAGVRRCGTRLLGENGAMSDGIHFDGDPATDSARRHMERVLKSPETTRRWPLVVAALGGGGLWLLFRWGRAAANAAAAKQEGSQETTPERK